MLTNLKQDMWHNLPDNPLGYTLPLCNKVLCDRIGSI